MKEFDFKRLNDNIVYVCTYALAEGLDYLKDKEDQAVDNLQLESEYKDEIKIYIDKDIYGAEGDLISSSPHSIFVHFGTGVYGAPENAPHRQTWWVYCTDPDEDKIGTGRKEPYYSFKLAMCAVLALRNKGKNAFCTQGREPTYFFSKTFEENKDELVAIITEAFYEGLEKL